MFRISHDMKRCEIKEMSKALGVYSRYKSLFEMSEEELKYMPKEVLITLCSQEIALVWDKLPDSLKEDSEIQQYQRCLEHHKHIDQPDTDVGDGPPPRKIDCSLCQIACNSVFNKKI